MLTNSVQTDIPRYTKLYAEKILRSFLPKRWAASLAQKKYCASIKNTDKYIKKCDGVFGPDFILRRGIDKNLFHPSKRNRFLFKDKFVLLFVGRIDEGKSIMTLAEAARLLLDQKQPVHLVLVGQGKLEEKIKTMLGENVTFAGALPHESLPPIYASADLFVSPSQIEVFPNVVIEAKASGLPVLMSKQGSASKVIKKEGVDGIVLESQDPKIWAEEIKGLILNRGMLDQLSKQAREHIENEWPTWEEVLAQDILPVWKKLCLGNGSSS